jgi:transcription antitermination factor NusG
VTFNFLRSVTERAVAYPTKTMEQDANLIADTDLLPWFALRIKSNFEKVTNQILEQKGYEAFLPTYRTRNRWSDRTKVIDRPLFPGYLFCRFDQNDRLPILVTPGVVGVVGVGKTPMAVAEREIEAIQAVLRSGLPATPWPYVTVGQRLLIERGPLSGIEGILQEIKNSFRFIVSVNLLQRSVAAEVDASWVRPVSSGKETLAYRQIA